MKNTSNQLETSKQSTTAITSLVLAMIIFGSIGFVAGKTGLHSFELVFVRCICATIFLGMIWVLSGKWKQETWNKKEFVRILLCGVILTLNWFFLFRAFEEMPVTVAVSIYYLAPVLVLLLGSLLYRERLTLLSIFAITLCFIGTMFVSGIGSGTSLKQLLSSGFVWAFLAAFLYALLTLLSKGVQQMSPYAVTFLQTFLGSLLLLPIVQFHSFTGLETANWIAITIIGCIHTGVVYYLFFGSVRKLSASLISALVFLDPAIAIVLDTLFTGFRPSMIQTLGIILIFTGMIITLIIKKPNK